MPILGRFRAVFVKLEHYESILQYQNQSHCTIYVQSPDAQQADAAAQQALDQELPF